MTRFDYFYAHEPRGAGIKHAALNRSPSHYRQESSEPRPQRIQLKRIKGWRMPANTVKIDRSTRWGNPFHIGQVSPDTDILGITPAQGLSGIFVRDRHHAVALLRDWLYSKSVVARTWRREAKLLRGKNLACGCPAGGPCHGDVLLAVANSEEIHVRSAVREENSVD
jgi:hypothetical protein